MGKTPLFSFQVLCNMITFLYKTYITTNNVYFLLKWNNVKFTYAYSLIYKKKIYIKRIGTQTKKKVLLPKSFSFLIEMRIFVCKQTKINIRKVVSILDYFYKIYVYITLGFIFKDIVS